MGIDLGGIVHVDYSVFFLSVFKLLPTTTTTLLPKKDFIQCFKKKKLKQDIGNNTQKN